MLEYIILIIFLDGEHILSSIKNILESSDFTSSDSLLTFLKEAATTLHVPFKELMAVTRLALTGLKVYMLALAEWKNAFHYFIIACDFILFQCCSTGHS